MRKFLEGASLRNNFLYLVVIALMLMAVNTMSVAKKPEIKDDNDRSIFFYHKDGHVTFPYSQQNR